MESGVSVEAADGRDGPVDRSASADGGNYASGRGHGNGGSDSSSEMMSEARDRVPELPPKFTTWQPPATGAGERRDGLSVSVDRPATRGGAAPAAGVGDVKRAAGLECTVSQPGVFFDPSARLFSLRTRNTQYSFRVDDNRNLEHLYYGAVLPVDDNLTYLSLGNVPGPFDPHGIVPSAQEQTLMQTLGLDELEFTSEQDLREKWRVYTRTKHESIASGDYENVGRPRRLENASWRLWQMKRGRGAAVDVEHDLSEEMLERALRSKHHPPGKSGSDDNAAVDGRRSRAEVRPTARSASEAAPRSLSAREGKPGPSLPQSPTEPRSQHNAGDTAAPPQLKKHSATSYLDLQSSLTGRRPGGAPEPTAPGDGGDDGRAAPKQVPPTSAHDAAADGEHAVGQSLSRLNLTSPALAAAHSGALVRSPYDASELDLDALVHASTAAVNWGKLDHETISKNVKLLEISDSGTGDYRIPTVGFIYDDGSTLSPFTYRRHRIRRGKLPMARHMPHVYVESALEATTLIVEMVDTVTGLVVELLYTVMHEYDVITRYARIRNESDAPVIVTRAMSATLDFETDTYYMTQLSGSWARERQEVTRRLDCGIASFGSTRGGSSHQHNPFVILSAGEPDEERGEAYAALLVYSGNFLVECEVGETGRARLNMGIHPQGFYWNLEPDEEFTTPEVVLAYSPSGIGRLSRALHRLIRERLQPPQFRDAIPPVLLNTWEAVYFNLSHESVVRIGEAAHRCGIEMLVIDDGWFGRRNDTLDGLGDWYPNPAKLPFGLVGLVRELEELGLQVGLWVEPEMVSVESDLFRQHPDWTLHIPSRGKTMGRNQLVLDLTREEVRDWLVDTLSEILGSCNLRYIKWDNNRFLTEVYSAHHPPERQGEIAHRYILGLYDVLGRLQEQFPQVFFETCAGGGGRFDAGMLYYSGQIWTSDNTDASSRMRIQAGTSLWAPAKSIASHVSTVPNHQTLRSASMKTRSLVAMCGTFGYELDPRLLTEDEVHEIRNYVQLFRDVAPVVQFGDMYRLWNPFHTPNCAWMYVSPDRQRAVVFAFNQTREVGRLEPRLRLRGLDPCENYEVEEWCPGVMRRNTLTGAIEAARSGVYQYDGNLLCMSGCALMQAGLPIKFVFDCDSVLLNVETVASKRVSNARRDDSDAVAWATRASLPTPEHLQPEA
ncbi:hypothetical protein CDCA_CDCA16G4148 [Cyanidium caldarium]|uniref:alpha-galactosidase n=1 Tax=Cyanidium caldarium TaxID=2771 RepID=A0AAV9J0L4_CYACA|nr:hypothetical protein CDCA_CDCA16G4148 [Cyanidium caldarium]